MRKGIKQKLGQVSAGSQEGRAWSTHTPLAPWSGLHPAWAHAAVHAGGAGSPRPCASDPQGAAEPGVHPAHQCRPPEGLRHWQLQVAWGGLGAWRPPSSLGTCHSPRPPGFFVPPGCLSSDRREGRSGVPRPRSHQRGKPGPAKDGDMVAPGPGAAPGLSVILSSKIAQVFPGGKPPCPPPQGQLVPSFSTFPRDLCPIAMSRGLNG